MTSSDGASSMPCTHGHASSVAASGRRNITSARCAIMPSRLTCIQRGLPAVQARGYDQLPPETVARFDRTHIGSVEPDALRRALAASVLALVNEGAEGDLRDAAVVAERLAELQQVAPAD